MTRSCEAGFTLLELLVGLVVLGFVLAGLGQGVRYGFRAGETQARMSAGQREMDAVDRVVRGLIERADPGARAETRAAAGAAPGTAPEPATLSGTAGRLVLTSTLPEAAGRNLADIAIGLDAARRLVLRWTPHRHVLATRPAEAFGEAELLRGVERIEFAYFQDGWRSAWDERSLPSLVRLRIVFPAGDARRWPDIVAQTMRSSDIN